MLGDLFTSPLCCGYLGYALPSIGRPPWWRDLYCWFNFLPGLALLYETSGVGVYKGPYTLTGPLLVCIYGAQDWNATQHTLNHACSRAVYVSHTRVATFRGKLCWFFMMNKQTSKMVFKCFLKVLCLLNPRKGSFNKWFYH